MRLRSETPNKNDDFPIRNDDRERDQERPFEDTQDTKSDNERTSMIRGKFTFSRSGGVVTRCQPPFLSLDKGFVMGKRCPPRDTPRTRRPEEPNGKIRTFEME